MESGFGIAVDVFGNAYVTGETWSFDFPLANPLQPFLRPVADVFVSKINPAGTALIYSTYLGGNDGEDGSAIVVDTIGNAYVAGTTFSSNFPTTPDAFQRVNISFSDVFLFKLNPNGTRLLYSTHIGGDAADVARVHGGDGLIGEDAAGGGGRRRALARGGDAGGGLARDLAASLPCAR
jgi:hypothetical protein